MALINYAMSFLVRRGYTPVQTPFFMRKVCVCAGVACASAPAPMPLVGSHEHVATLQECMSECAQLEDFDEQLYKARPLCIRLPCFRVSVLTITAAGVWGGRREVPDRHQRADAVQHVAPQVD
jgi:hypothetical protein